MHAARRAAKAELIASFAAEMPVRIRVRGPSMEPTLVEGDTVDVHKRRIYWPGDIVVFPDGASVLKVHRVLGPLRAAGAWHYVTRGDACNVPDSPVLRARVIGKVVNAPTSGPIRAAFVRAKAIVEYAFAIAHYVRERR